MDVAETLERLKKKAEADETLRNRLLETRESKTTPMNFFLASWRR